jgi:hypothetical protein
MHFFCIDTTLLYGAFFTDFGPLNLGCTYRFCMMVNNKLKVGVPLLLPHVLPCLTLCLGSHLLLVSCSGGWVGLQDPKLKDKVIYFYCSAKPQHKSNAACLVGLYSVRRSASCSRPPASALALPCAAVCCVDMTRGAHCGGGG